MNEQPPPLPDVIVEHVRQLQGDAEGHQWRVGDSLVDIVDELEGRYTALGVRRARAWLIGHISDRIGADRSTLRDRESVCRFFPPAVRQQYDVLSWSQFRAVKSAGDDWRQYADWALENLPAPVRVIRARIKNNGHDVAPWVGRWDRLQSIAEKLAGEDGAPADLRLLARLILFWR